MKNFVLYLCLGLALFFSACNMDNAAFTLKGKIDDASDMQLYLDRTQFNNTNDILQKTDIAGDGSFKMGLEEHPGAGIYRVRIGAKKGYLVLDGTEKKVELNGKLADFDASKQQAVGSTATQKYLELEQKIKGGQMNIEALRSLVPENESTVTSFLAYNHFRKKIDSPTIQTLKDINTKLKSDYPNQPISNDFDLFVNNQVQSYKQLYPIIEEEKRKAAKEINYPSPSGKRIALSSLKGKVVLVDFWASWCRPCRIVNPSVVALYDKYNKDGFEVFNVSLDKDKKQWEAAIAQDNLKWKYHVSDLKHWASKPAKEWGVSGIPRTFLLDREGRIAAINVNNPTALENAIKELL